MNIFKSDSDKVIHNKMQEDMRASEEKWRMLFQIMPAGVTILNSDRVITDMNPRIESILGVTKEKLLAGDYKNWKYLRSDGSEMPPEEFPSNRAIKEQKVIRHVEIGVVKGDGTVVWTDVSAAPLFHPDAACVVVTSDITARKKMEEELKSRLIEAERLNKLMTDRELKMVELKNEIEDLKLKLQNK